MCNVAYGEQEKDEIEVFKLWVLVTVERTKFVDRLNSEEALNIAEKNAGK